jgi:hypothetical protein
MLEWSFQKPGGLVSKSVGFSGRIFKIQKLLMLSKAGTIGNKLGLH